MTYKVEDWVSRMARRSDITAQLTHLTRGNAEFSAIDVLAKILIDRKLIAAPAYTYGGQKVVCFQDAPLAGIVQNLISEKEMRETKKANGGEPVVRYEPAGITFFKTYVFKKGGRPVFYEPPKEAKKILPKDEWWRIVPMDYSVSPPVDWTHEREWRVLGDFSFDLDKCCVVVGNAAQYREIVDKVGVDTVRAIAGMTVLNHAYY